jgi:hypothetical protein
MSVLDWGSNCFRLSLLAGCRLPGTEQSLLRTLPIMSNHLRVKAVDAAYHPIGQRHSRPCRNDFTGPTAFIRLRSLMTGQLRDASGADKQLSSYLLFRGIQLADTASTTLSTVVRNWFHDGQLQQMNPDTMHSSPCLL